MSEFNSAKPIGSIYENSFREKEKKLVSEQDKLVDFVCYCLNPNHYHFVLKQLTDNGISQFMHKVSTGFTNYFNLKYKLSGSLFQGRFRALHVNSNEYLLHLSAYVNLNDKVHQLRSSTPKLSKSSWGEYKNYENGFCNKKIILEQFKDHGSYEVFAESALLTIQNRKEMERSLSLGS